MASSHPSVIVIGPFPPPLHGAARITASMADALDAHVTVERANIAPHSLKRGSVYHLVRLARVMNAAAQIAEGMKGGGTVYISAAGGLGLLYNTFLAMTARLLGRRVFIHHHSFAYLDKWNWKAALLVRGAGRGAEHICLCPRMGDLLHRLYRLDKPPLVLSNAAFYAPGPRGALANKSGALRVGHLSNLGRDKGLDLVLDVAREGTGVVSKLVLGGVAENRDAQSLIDEARETLGDRLESLGQVVDDAKPAFFEAIDVFLFPTRYRNEAEPTVLIEALAAGIPVIAYGRGCIPTMVPEPAGMIIAPDAAFVPAALEKLKFWSENRDALGAASREALGGAQAAHEEAKAARAAIIDAMIGGGNENDGKR